MPTKGVIDRWVMGSGPIPPPSGLMVVGEAPAEQEVRMGVPLVGPSGKELDQQLLRWGKVWRGDVYVTNVFPYPLEKPASRLTPDEMERARERLMVEMGEVRPRVVLMLGAVACHCLLPETRQHDMETINAIPLPLYVNAPIDPPICIPSFHPAAAFRDSSKLQYLIDACKCVGEVLRGRRGVEEVSSIVTQLATCERHTSPLSTLTAIDTESESSRDRVAYMVSFSSIEGEAVVTFNERKVLDRLGWHVARPDVTTLLHNALYDLPILWRLGVYPRKWVDTMTVAFMLQYLPLSLKELAWRVLQTYMPTYEDTVGKWGGLKEAVENGEREKVVAYSASDPDATLRLHNALLPRWYPGMEGVLERDMDIQPMVVRMMERGIGADAEFFRRLDEEFEARNYLLFLQIEEFAKKNGFDTPVKSGKYKGTYFNPKSGPQIARLLYDVLGLGKGKGIKKVASGRLSTNKKMTARLVDEHPIVRQIEQYKSTETLRSNYVQVLPRHVKEDGRIHTDLSMVRVPHSGRFASSKPNLLAQPIRSDDGRRIREGFVAAEGWEFISGDLSQIEMRCLAHNSQDPTLLEIFRTGKDVHTQTGMKIFGISDPSKLDDYKHRIPAKCFHPDTEVLTKRGWVKIPELECGEEVVQGTPKRHGQVELEWVVPLQVYTTKHESKKLIHLSNYGIDIRVTPDHGMLGWTTQGYPFKAVPEEWITRTRCWANAGVMGQGSSVSCLGVLIQIAVAIQADGNITPEKAVRWGFSKGRKVARLERLLKEAGMEYTKSVGSNLVTRIYVNRGNIHPALSLLAADKTFPWWWLGLSMDQRILVLDELKYWDGYKAVGENRTSVTSYAAKNLDVIQALAAITGRKSRQGSHHRITIANHATSRSGNVMWEEEDWTDEVACLSVPSTCVLVRYNGVTLLCHQTTGFGIVNLISAQGLSRELRANGAGDGWTEDRCQDLIDEWFRIYSQVKRHFVEIEGYAVRTGTTVDMWGRREIIPQIYSVNENTRAEGVRIACNQRIQSSAQGIIKQIMRSVWRKYGDWWREWDICHPIIQIHDDLVMECREEYVEEVAGLVRKEMETAVVMSVPVKVGMKRGRVWGRMEKMKEAA